MKFLIVGFDSAFISIISFIVMYCICKAHRVTDSCVRNFEVLPYDHFLSLGSETQFQTFQCDNDCHGLIFLRVQEQVSALPNWFFSFLTLSTSLLGPRRVFDLDRLGLQDHESEIETTKGQLHRRIRNRSVHWVTTCLSFCPFCSYFRHVDKVLFSSAFNIVSVYFMKRRNGKYVKGCK